MPAPLRTIGHGGLSEEPFTRLLRDAGVAVVVDVRRRPGSRRHPQFQRRAMQRWLADAGIDHRWVEALGGHREPDPASPNLALDEPLRAYADHLSSPDGRSALRDLLDLAEQAPTAICCAEGDWRRCHRRVLADAVVLLGDRDVHHLHHDGGSEPHMPDPAARIVDGVLRYDRGEDAPLWI